MAATKLTCPECGNILRPARPMAAGKRVKCPECSTMFVAQDDDEPTGKSDDDTDEPVALPSQPPAKKPKKAKKSADGKPAKKKPAAKRGDDDDDGPATYGYIDDHRKEDEPEIDYVPDTAIKDLRGPAQAAVIRPSNFMMLFGSIGFFCYLLFCAIFMIPVIFPNPVYTDPSGAVKPVDPEKAKKEAEAGSLFMIITWDLMQVSEYPWWAITLMCVTCFFGMIYCGIATYGAVRMQTLESRVWGMVSAVMMILPASSLGTFAMVAMILTFVFYLIMDLESMYFALPIWIAIAYGGSLASGIWSLIILNRQDVIDGYEYVEE